MALDFWIFARKPLDLFITQMPAKAGIELARKIMIELREQLNVEKKDGCRGEFVGYNVKEDFWALVFVFFRCTLLRL